MRYHFGSDEMRAPFRTMARAWDADVAETRRRKLSQGDVNPPHGWTPEREARYQRIYKDSPNPFE